MVDESLDDILAVKGFGNMYFVGDILVIAKVKEAFGPTSGYELKKLQSQKIYWSQCSQGNYFIYHLF